MDKVEVAGNAGQGNSFTEATVEDGSFYPQVREVTHHHYHGIQRPFASETTLSSTSLAGTYHLFVTHEAIGVSRLLRQATQHIVLHAAFYPKYSQGEQGEDIWKAMKANDELKLKVIFTDVKPSWVDEFAVTLREGFSKKGEFEKRIGFDKQQFNNIPEGVNPENIQICDSARLPLFPVILIDNTLIVGHYAHSEEIAPNGFWLTIQHPKISEMYENLLHGNRPKCSTPEERAIIRYLDELMV